jgi:membrane protein implicated in regulation of membrane protease activity
MRFFKYPSVPDTSSDTSPGLIVAALFIVIMWGIFGFIWWLVFVAIFIGAVVDMMLGYEQVVEPKQDTEVVYRKKGK